MSTTPAAPQPPPTWHLIRRLLALAWQYRLGCSGLISIQIVLMLLGVASLYLVGLGFDVIRHQLAPATTPAPHWIVHVQALLRLGPQGQIATIGCAMLALAAVRAAFSHFYTFAVVWVVQQGIVVGLRTRIYDKLQRLSFRFFDGSTTGSIINRVTSDVQGVRSFVDGVLMQSIIMVIALGLNLAYMIALSPRLTVACLSTVPVLWIATAVFSRLVRPEYQRNRDLYDRMILTYTESMQGVQVTKGFAREDERHQTFAQANAAVRDQQGRIFWRVSVFTPLIDMLPQLSLVVILLYGGAMVMDGTLKLGEGLIVFIGLMSQFSAQINGIANVTNTAQQSLVAAGRVFEILDTPIEIVSPAEPKRLPRLKGHVRFEHVAFHYRPAELVLSDITLDVPAGSCVAILGATGAGKSSLLSLIPRFYDPAAGRITIDGIDLRELDLRLLRRSIGLVFQESFLFSNTIAANIAFGDPGASMERIQAAAKIAQAHDFITAQPEGYHTVLGESGVTLSGGQRQRLSIARAVLLEPPILLLDDPTAAIDPETEHEILAALDRAIVGRTTFIVAHRLSTLRRADHVIVVEGGRIVEAGSHDQLLSAGGHYARAARLQLAHDGEPPRQPAGGARP